MIRLFILFGGLALLATSVPMRSVGLAVMGLLFIVGSVL